MAYEVWVCEGRSWAKHGPFPNNDAAVAHARECRKGGSAAFVEAWGALESRAGKRSAEIVKTASGEIEAKTRTELFGAHGTAAQQASVARPKQASVARPKQASVSATVPSHKTAATTARPSLLMRNDKLVKAVQPAHVPREPASGIAPALRGVSGPADAVSAEQTAVSRARGGVAGAAPTRVAVSVRREITPIRRITPVTRSTPQESDDLPI